MTNDEWLKHFEEAYKLPFRNDIRVDRWEKREFSPKEREFLLSEYSEEFKNLHQQAIKGIVQIMTRYLFKKAAQGYTFCMLEKIESTFGKTLEQNFGVSTGYFYNLAKTYWTFKVQLDEEPFQYVQKKSTPLFFMILRTAEVNIASGFFPTGSYVSEANQRQILKEFAPEINIEKFISENPMLKTGKGGCLYEKGDIVPKQLDT
jgi:hypothetical protein